MNKTYITIMPDKAGSFLKASSIISKQGGNIIRVNYSKTVDIHTLFIEVSASQLQHEKITKKLHKIGYLLEKKEEKQAILIVLKLEDKPGAVTPALKIIDKYNINITYMNSQENGTPFQYFKMGLLVDNPKEIKELLEDLSKICEVKVIDYNITEKALDNTVFYITFANKMRNLLELDQKETNSVLINSNRIMQFLESRNESPMKTFDYIFRFAKFVQDHKGLNFHSIITKEKINDQVNLYLIEVSCGSNTIIFEYQKNLFFIDCGFACYRDEMTSLFYRTFSDFDSYHKEIFITHCDMDHTGLLDLFDTVHMSQSCYDNFRLEQKGEADFREQNPLHAPYCKLSKIITGYKTPKLKNAKIIGKKNDNQPYSKIGSLDFAGLHFDAIEENGGHVKGDTILVCENPKMVFTGDIIVNIKGFSDEQREFNTLAPYLMTSVNMDSQKATQNRNLLLEKYKGYKLYPAHGPCMEN
ncbi:MAG: MBL fold metallo-hydrolase [Treponemataceae bacterium]|nr:MBL fold metallo-hydrolase [Treponemataceae bacterium]